MKNQCVCKGNYTYVNQDCVCPGNSTDQNPTDNNFTC